MIGLYIYIYIQIDYIFYRDYNLFIVFLVFGEREMMMTLCVMMSNRICM